MYKTDVLLKAGDLIGRLGAGASAEARREQEAHAGDAKKAAFWASVVDAIDLLENPDKYPTPL